MIFKSIKHSLTTASNILMFILFMIKEIAKSSIKVSKESYKRNQSINSGIIEFDSVLLCGIKTTILANCITITPGTLTIKVERLTGDSATYRLFVHVLWKNDYDSIINDIKLFEKKIESLW